MRHPDWQTRLEALVQHVQAEAFRWGHNDCCTFAAQAVQAVTGRDVLPLLPGRWHSARTARTVLRELGGLQRACDRFLGPRIAPALAQPGDIGLVYMGRMHALCVHLGSHYMAPTGLGLQPMSTQWVAHAWRVCNA